MNLCVERWIDLCGIDGNGLTFGLLLLFAPLLLLLFLIGWRVERGCRTVARCGGTVGRAGWGVLRAAGAICWGGWGIFGTRWAVLGTGRTIGRRSGRVLGGRR